MGYLALYRKYRPSLFNDMVGQDDIRKILLSSIENNTISHAYLFSGPRGTGKTTTAKILAKIVNCEHLVDGQPCNECASCLAINSGSDVIEIDAASNNGVDEIRDLREKVNLVPNVCRYKVYIIDEVHMLTTQAFNALLKTLEEPPKHIIFILATTEYYKIPLTITSRCQKFQFKKLDDSDIVDRLRYIAKSEDISISDAALYEIAKLSDGGMRDAINFLDQLRSYTLKNIEISDVYDVCGNVSLVQIAKFLIDIRNNDCENVALFLEDLNNCGKNYGKFLEDVVSFLNDLIIYKRNVNSDFIKGSVELLRDVANLYSDSEIYSILEMVDKLIEKIRFASRQSVIVVSNFLMVMENLCVSKCDENDGVNPECNLNFKVNNENDSKKKSVNMVDDYLHVKESSKENFMVQNKLKIINNSLALANKDLKNEVVKKWLEISNYLSDINYSVYAGKLIDINVEVAGKGYLILTAKYDSVIENIYSLVDEYQHFIEMLLGDKYNFAIISTNEWEELKKVYVNNVKNGKKYVVEDLIVESTNESTETVVIKKNDTLVDQLFDIFGEESVEIK